MADNSRLDLEIVDVKQMIIGTDPAEGVIVTVELVGERKIDMHLSPYALSKLEAFLVRANAEQAKHQPIH